MFERLFERRFGVACEFGGSIEHTVRGEDRQDKHTGKLQGVEPSKVRASNKSLQVADASKNDGDEE